MACLGKKKIGQLFSMSCSKIGHLHEASRFVCMKWMAINKGMITIWLSIEYT